MTQYNQGVGAGAIVAASLDPETFTEGGLFEGNGVIRQPRFVRWDYGGRKDLQGQPISSLAIRMVLVDGEGVGHEQFWSAGGLEDFIPSPDGTMAIPQSGKTGLNRNTNAALLLTEIINCGFPKNRLTAQITCLDGLYAAFIRRKAPDRPGLNQQRQPNQREAQVLVPVQILNLPWEPSKHPNGGQIVKMAETRQPGQGGQDGQAQTIPVPQSVIPGAGVTSNLPPINVPTASNATALLTSPAPSLLPDAELDGVMHGFLVATLADGPKTKQELAQRVFQPAGGVNQHPRRNEISSWVFNDGYLSKLAAEGFVKFDGQTVTKAG